MLLIDKESGAECLPDMSQYAAIDPVFCHSGNPSGRTGRSNRHGNDHADCRSLDSTYRAGDSDSSAVTSSPWISTKIIRASAASAAARSAATARRARMTIAQQARARAAESTARREGLRKLRMPPSAAELSAKIPTIAALPESSAIAPAIPAKTAAGTPTARASPSQAILQKSCLSPQYS